MANTGMTFDMKDVNKKLGAFGKLTHEAAYNGMVQAGIALFNDAIFQQPTVPLLEGSLRGSGSLIVDGKAEETASNLGYGKGDPATSVNNKLPSAIVATVGFNEPYAAKMHEHPDYNFSEPGSGANFLTAKLTKFGTQYMQILVDEIKKMYGV